MQGQRTVSGVVLGILLCFVVGVIVTVAEISLGRVTTPLWWWLALFSLPVVGLVVLLVPRWRRAGAGLVLGMAIGSVVFAGVCGAYLGVA